MKKAATKAERRHLDRVASLGCIACQADGYEDTPAEIHHLDRNRNHMRVIPLCPYHHRDGGYGFAVHAGRPIWTERYGTEEELLEQVNKQVGTVL